MHGSDKKPTFNHDLLAHAEDIKSARQLYRGVADALFHPELIEYFTPFDDQANKAKRNSRKWGTVAILLGGGGILVAVVEVAIKVYWPTTAVASPSIPTENLLVLLIIGLTAAVFGLSSVLIAISGTLLGRRKQEWLLNRFMGERIRQFHFQTLIAQLPLILAMTDTETDDRNKTKDHRTKAVEEKRGSPSAVESFLNDRRRRFEKFKSEFNELGRQAKFGATVDPGGETDWRLCQPDEAYSATKKTQPTLQVFFEAYRALRIQHQLNYANYKLTSDPRIFSDMPRRQSEILEWLSNSSILVVTLVHACVLVIVVLAFVFCVSNVFADLRWAVIITPIFFFSIMTLAVISLCLHAFARGLQPEREIERYQQYRSTLAAIRDQFDEANDATEKIKVMWQMERAAFAEMRNFVLTHYGRASFAM